MSFPEDPTPPIRLLGTSGLLVAPLAGTLDKVWLALKSSFSFFLNFFFFFFILVSLQKKRKPVEIWPRCTQVVFLSSFLFSWVFLQTKALRFFTRKKGIYDQGELRSSFFSYSISSLLFSSKHSSPKQFLITDSLKYLSVFLSLTIVAFLSPTTMCFLFLLSQLHFYNLHESSSTKPFSSPTTVYWASCWSTMHCIYISLAGRVWKR